MTTLYWRFLIRHEAEFAGNPRTALMVRNLARLSEEECNLIAADGERMLANLDGL